MKQNKRLGSMTSTWCDSFIGKQILLDLATKEQWLDFSDPNKVIFGYPPSPGVYAKFFRPAAGCDCHDIMIFLFAATDKGKITGVSYSVMAMNADGSAEDMEAELAPEDVEQAKKMLSSIL
jgi:hypothetical protein